MQHNLTKKIDILIFISISLKIIAWQSGIGQTPEKNDFYCTLRYHCNAIFEGNWTKFMSFWKIFSCSFEWDQRKIFSPNRVKDMSLQSYKGKTQNSTTTTAAVIWHFLAKFQFTSGFLAKIIKLQQNSTKKIDILIFISISLKKPLDKVGLVKHLKKKRFLLYFEISL